MSITYSLEVRYASKDEWEGVRQAALLLPSEQGMGFVGFLMMCGVTHEVPWYTKYEELCLLSWLFPAHEFVLVSDHQVHGNWVRYGFTFVGGRYLQHPQKKGGPTTPTTVQADALRMVMDRALPVLVDYLTEFLEEQPAPDEISYGFCLWDSLLFLRKRVGGIPV